MERLRVACNKDSADYWEVGANKIGNFLNTDLNKYFGPLVTVIQGHIMVDPFLLECYVKDFINHSSELAISEQIENKFSDDINIYSDIVDWAKKNTNYLSALSGSADNFNPQTWDDPYKLRVLCGPKGCGKTTLLLFTKSRLEKEVSNNIRCIYINLANIGFEIPDLIIRKRPIFEKFAKYINEQLICRLDQICDETINLKGIAPSEMVRERFKYYWNSMGLYPEKTDTKGDLKRKLRKREDAMIILNQHKYNTEFFNYVVHTLKYIKKSLNLKLILMFDDVDRLKNIEDARDIINYSSSLARKLGIVPIIVSSRVETLALLADMDDQAIEKFPIIPPSFGDMLKRRIINFNNEYKVDKTRLVNEHLTISEIKEFVNFIIDSMLDDNNLLQLILFHYDMDILLDMVKCTITSPFIEYDYVMNLKKSNKKLPWHIMLDSLMRYKYLNFYEENSFIMNVYDNDTTPSPQNTLIRVRVIQVIRTLMRHPNEPIKVGEIYANMNYLGYQKSEVIKAMRALAKQRLIVTGKHYNAFLDDLYEVIPTRAVPYYLRNLIFNYRYIQNVLPVTPVPFDISSKFTFQKSPLRFGDLNEMDKYILNFIDFIGECEALEQKKIKDKSIYNNISGNRSISQSLRECFNQERTSMIKSGL